MVELSSGIIAQISPAEGLEDILAVMSVSFGILNEVAESISMTREPA